MRISAHKFSLSPSSRYEREYYLTDTLCKTYFGGLYDNRVGKLNLKIDYDIFSYYVDRVGRGHPVEKYEIPKLLPSSELFVADKFVNKKYAVHFESSIAADWYFPSAFNIEIKRCYRGVYNTSNYFIKGEWF